MQNNKKVRGIYLTILFETFQLTCKNPLKLKKTKKLVMTN